MVQLIYSSYLQYMDNLLILGVFEAFILAILMFKKKPGNIADRVLATYFFIFGLNILLSYIEQYNRIHDYPFPHFINTTAPFVLLHGPLLWLYVEAQTTDHFKLRPVHLLHILPFIFMFANHMSHVYLMSVEERIAIVKTEAFTEYLSYPVFVIMIALSPLIYFLLGIRRVRNYNDEIKNQLSRIEAYDLSWLKKVLIVATILYCMVNITFVIDLFITISSFRSLQNFAFLSASVFVLVLGFYGHKQHNLFDSPLLERPKKGDPSDDNQPTPQSGDDVFVQKLRAYMRAEKPYLNPEITVFKLSRELHVNQEFLSNILNNVLKKNFFDFINQYRIEEYKHLVSLEEYKHLTLLSIAYECGFNSKATFNRVFKNATGLTPSQYRQRLVGSDTTKM